MRPLPTAALALLLAASAATAAREPSIYDELARQLQRVATGDGVSAARQHAGLTALRLLRDEKLRPLMADLSASERPDLRAVGILGLAELSDDALISLALVGEMKSPAEQSLVLLEALSEGRLSDDQIQQVLAWPKLDPRLDIALRARLMSKGARPDAERLAAIADFPVPAVAALGDALLVADGDAKRADKILRAAAAADPESRRMILDPVIEMLAREKLAVAAPLLRQLLPFATDDDHRAAMLSSLMSLSPKDGAEEWTAQWTKASDLGDRVRLALAALRADRAATPAIAQAMIDSAAEPVATAGRALSASIAADPKALSEALTALASTDHPRSVSWAIARAGAMPAPEARATLLAMVRAQLERRDTDDEAPASLFDIASRLAALDAGALAAPLNAAVAKSDRAACEALLAALLRSGFAPVWEAGSPPKLPGRTAQAMAVIYEARLAGLRPGITADSKGVRASGGGFPNNPERAELLRQIALGWGSVPESFRAVAAWLALCQEGREREALARVLTRE